MPNPNIHYKEINKLLKELDIEIEKVKNGDSKGGLSLLGINILNNKFGINSKKLDSIVSTFKKYRIIKHSLQARGDWRYFVRTDINSNIINEIKNLHEFDFESYVNKLEEPTLIAKSSKWASWTSVIIATISAGISIYQCKSSDTNTENITAKYNQAKMSIDSLSQIQEEMQHRTTGLEDSLKSLKSKTYK